MHDAVTGTINPDMSAIPYHAQAWRGSIAAPDAAIVTDGCVSILRATIKRAARAERLAATTADFLPRAGKLAAGHAADMHSAMASACVDPAESLGWAELSWTVTARRAAEREVTHRIVVLAVSGERGLETLAISADYVALIRSLTGEASTISVSRKRDVVALNGGTAVLAPMRWRTLSVADNVVTVDVV